MFIMLHGRLIPHGLVVHVCSSLGRSVRKGSTGGLLLRTGPVDLGLYRMHTIHGVD
jgi:hypothetical protein